MELWVRSQDRETLIRIKNVSIDNENFVLGNLVSDDNKSVCDYWILGKYKTKRRALEVLDEIHQRLINIQCIELIGANNITQQMKRKMKRNGVDCVYEMPEE